MSESRVRAPFRRLPADRRREEILEVALDLFGRRGEDGVSMDEIGVAAGASRNSVYRLFGGKDQLHLAAMELLVSKLVKAQAAPVSGTPSEELATRLHRHFDVVERYDAGYLALIRLAGPDASEETRALLAEMRGWTYDRIYRSLGIDEPEPAVEAAVHAWVATMEWMTKEWLWQRHSPRHLPREDVEALLSYFLGAMLIGAASREQGSPEWLQRLVASESAVPGSPFATHMAGMGDLFANATLMAQVRTMVIGS